MCHKSNSWKANFYYKCRPIGENVQVTVENSNYSNSSCYTKAFCMHLMPSNDFISSDIRCVAPPGELIAPESESGLYHDSSQ